ncbi:hypothetical protein SNEBB_006950 [Seison nebaliae]|nr:hypothetical protein SNEBB_006950 [Seison nebaliae]
MEDVSRNKKIKMEMSDMFEPLDKELFGTNEGMLQDELNPFLHSKRREEEGIWFMVKINGHEILFLGCTGLTKTFITAELATILDLPISQESNWLNFPIIGETVKTKLTTEVQLEVAGVTFLHKLPIIPMLPHQTIYQTLGKDIITKYLLRRNSKPDDKIIGRIIDIEYEIKEKEENMKLRLRKCRWEAEMFLTYLKDDAKFLKNQFANSSAIRDTIDPNYIFNWTKEANEAFNDIKTFFENGPTLSLDVSNLFWSY